MIFLKLKTKNNSLSAQIFFNLQNPFGGKVGQLCKRKRLESALLVYSMYKIELINLLVYILTTTMTLQAYPGSPVSLAVKADAGQRGDSQTKDI